MLDLRTTVPLGSRDEELGRLTDRELSPLFRFLLRVRLAAVPLMLTVAGLLFFIDPAPWKITLALVAATLLAALGLRDRPLFDSPRLPPRRALELLGSAMSAHVVLITISGGLHSPFVVILPVMILLTAVAVGRVRLVVTIAVIVVGVVWLLAADDLIGPHPRLVPSTLPQVLPILGGPAFALTMATILTIVTTAAVLFGLAIRAAVERAIAAAREAQTETLATLGDRNRELWTLSGAIAHELKNPLASVKGLGTLLARRVEAGTKQAERMGVMLEEVERMGSIIDEFLNFSRPLTAMTRKDVEPRALVDKAIALHRPLAEPAGVTLEAEIASAETITCDPRKLMQVLVNLLHNAIDASPRGSTILVRVESEGDQTRLSVLDRGPGLDPEIRARLFQPGSTTKPSGSGIGLTVARAIAEQHGGTLRLDDRPEGGCRAVLSLPTRPPREEEEPA